MSAVSSREKNMLMVAGVLLLYAFGALIYKQQIEDWKIAKRGYANAVKKFNDERALIASRKEWSDRYEQLSSLMPVFPYEKDVDTHWLNTMDSVATRNKLTITRRQASKEELVGDVYELPVDCKDWEGTLESLVTFLYDLNKEGAMLDVRQIFVRPSPRGGFLKGTFTLYCAYMRGDEEVLPAKAAAEEPAPEAEEAGAPADGDEPPAAEEPRSTPKGLTGPGQTPPAAEEKRDAPASQQPPAHAPAAGKPVAPKKTLTPNT